MTQRIAAAGQGVAEIAWPGRQDENIDDVLACPINEGRYWLSLDQVEPTADQRKARRGEIDAVRRQISAPGEPRLDRVLVG